MVPLLDARSLLSAMREAEFFYLQVVACEPESWIERHLSRARLKLYDELLKHCPPDGTFPDDHEKEKHLRDDIDAIAWQVVWGSVGVLDEHLPVLLGNFAASIPFSERMGGQKAVRDPS